MIIDTAIQNYAYDNQSEGSRAKYVYGLYLLSREKEKIKSAILNTFEKYKEDDFWLVQMYDLVILFAKEGDKRARELAYKKIQEDNYAYLWGARDMLPELDGLEGLRFEYLCIAKAGDDWYGSAKSDLEEFQQAHPEIDLEGAMKKWAEEDEDFASYYKGFLAYKEQEYKPFKEVDIDCLIKEKRESVIYAYVSRNKKAFTPEKMRAFGNGFLSCEEEAKESYLAIFTRYPYPYKDLLPYAQAEKKEGERVVEFAVKALNLLPDEEIRMFALQKISEAKKACDYTAIFENHYKEGDELLLENLAKACRDEDDAECLVFDYAAIYKKNSTPKCQAPLLSLYEKLTCGIHRLEIVEIMEKNGALPVHIKEELLYDSYEETRAFAKTVS